MFAFLSEFCAINRQLDLLESALNDIESRNEGIHKELLELLQSNREIRESIIQEKKEGADDTPLPQGSVNPKVTEKSTVGVEKGLSLLALEPSTSSKSSNSASNHAG